MPPLENIRSNPEGSRANEAPQRAGCARDPVADKPVEWTSNRALQRVRRLYNAAKAGHTGSLDPLATGMLPICLGSATKVCSYLLDARKSYRVTARLGAATDSGECPWRDHRPHTRDAAGTGDGAEYARRFPWRERTDPTDAFGPEAQGPASLRTRSPRCGSGAAGAAHSRFCRGIASLPVAGYGVRHHLFQGRLRAHPGGGRGESPGHARTRIGVAPPGRGTL